MMPDRPNVSNFETIGCTHFSDVCHEKAFELNYCYLNASVLLYALRVR